MAKIVYHPISVERLREELRAMEVRFRETDVRVDAVMRESAEVRARLIELLRKFRN